MTTPMTFVQIAFLSVICLAGIATIAREAVYRLKSGPVRFRLPLASLARPPRGATRSAILIFVALTLMIPGAVSIKDPLMRAVMIVMVLAVASGLHSGNPRRDARRRLVLASGLLVLAVGAILLALGSRDFPVGELSMSEMLSVFMIVLAVLSFVFGAATIQESLSGTRVREGGIELFGMTRPWSRVIVTEWHEREGGFGLGLTVRSPWLFGMSYARDLEIIVPVSASDRLALESFLAGHATTAGRSRVGEDAGGFPEKSATGGGDER